MWTTSIMTLIDYFTYWTLRLIQFLLHGQRTSIDSKTIPGGQNWSVRQNIESLQKINAHPKKGFHHLLFNFWKPSWEAHCPKVQSLGSILSNHFHLSKNAFDEVSSLRVAQLLKNAYDPAIRSFLLYTHLFTQVVVSSYEFLRPTSSN